MNECLCICVFVSMYFPVCVCSVCVSMFGCVYHLYTHIYIRRIIGGVFNLAVWQIIFNLPNLIDFISCLCCYVH